MTAIGRWGYRYATWDVPSGFHAFRCDPSLAIQIVRAAATFGEQAATCPLEHKEEMMLVARFGDPSAKETIESVMRNADEHSDRLSAVIALWTLGDNSGIQMAIKYVKAPEQPYGGWDTPIWFLMRIRTKEAMDALKAVVKNAPAERAGDVLYCIICSITGELNGEKREAAGCLEVCPVLIAGMERSDYTGGSINDVKPRIKDEAAKALALLRGGKRGWGGGRFLQVDTELFNELEPDEAKRDAQIRSLKEWYEQNKGKLTWDSKKQKLVMK